MAAKPATKRAANTRGRGQPPKTTPAAQAAQQFTNRYDAAGQGRRLAGWRPPNSGPNVALTGLDNIRTRASDTVRNDWAGSAGLQRWTTTLIGTGIRPRLGKDLGKNQKKRYNKLWKDWCKVCDADNVLDFYGLQTMVTRSWLERGEVFVRMRSRRATFGMDVPLQVQVIEADYVPMLDADNWPDMRPGNRIRSGIEFDRSNQRVAYWVYREHPGDNRGLSSIDISKLLRVPKDEMLHIFEPKRPGQLRGVPDIAPVLTHLRNMMDFGDNVLERQKIANLWTIFLTKMQPSYPQDTTDPLTGRPIEQTSSGGVVGLMPATMVELNQGEKPEFANPPEPGVVYPDYMRTNHLYTAAGLNLPNEILTGDIKEISDRTLRVIINEFRRFAEQRQYQIIIPMFCQPVRDRWTMLGVLANQIALADEEAVRDVMWAPHGWAYIHPVQDVQARQAEVEAKFRSRSSVIGERGDDPEEVDQEIADDQQREEDLGIAPDPMQDPAQQQAGGKSKAKPDGDGIAPGEYPRNARFDRLRAEKLEAEIAVIRASAEPKGPSDTAVLLDAFAKIVAQQQEQMNATMQAFSNVLKAFAERPLVTQVAAPTVENTVNVEPTPVQIENKNTVNVEPTPVEITNDVTNNIDVQPAQVKVELPDREITSDITRDSKGDITKVIQTETTIKPTTH